MREDFVILEDERAATVRLYNPAGFDPRRHLPTDLWRHADSVRYFVHVLHHLRFMNKRGRDDFIEIKAAYMIPFFTVKADYRPVIDTLIGQGVLECDGHYEEGRKSLGYRLGAAYRDRPFRAVQVSEPALVRKILRKREEQHDRITWDVHRHLRAWVERIEFDYPAALDYSARTGLEEYGAVLDALHEGDLFFVPCEYGRVHHNVTSLKSEFRAFLSYKGQRLINLDIRNSQPLLFSVVVINYFLSGRRLDSLYAWEVDNSGLYYELHPSLFLLHEESSTPSQPNGPLPLPRLITERGSGACWKDTSIRLLAHGLPPDAVLYAELVQRGLFYEYLMEEGDIPKDRRAEYKRSFFGGVFFCKNRPLTRQAELFRRLFPSVYEVAYELKRKDHRRLAHILQRTESSLLINRVARRCMDELPGTCIVTIHDSVLTVPHGVEGVKAIMTQEFAKVGLEPTIKEEGCGGETAG